MSRLANLSFDQILAGAKDLDVKSLIDLAILSTKKISIEVNKNEFTELLASYGFILDSQNILLLTTKQKDRSSLPGFYSINDKLIDKTSLAVNKSLKGVKLIIYKESDKCFQYKKITKSVRVDSKTQHNQLISLLEEMEYQRVEYVDEERQYCIKGGIIDFYSPIHENPIRAYFYDNETEYLYYNLGTGMPKDIGLETVDLSKNEKNMIDFEIKDLINKYSYENIDRSLSSKNKTINKISVSKLQKAKDINYLKHIYYNAYEIDKKIYAPLHYKKINKSSDKKGFMQGFERGDIVCHEDYGVGEFVGLNSFTDDEYVKIKYNDGTINLAVSQLFKLSFVSRETENSFTINSLSKKGVWARKVKTLRKSASEYVDKLVDMYSKREFLSRPAFAYGGAIEKSFIDCFQYEPTADQVLVWEQIARDLELETPMSRLLCGDVGFGKTEMAVRASFRVAINGGKVLVLCPTSILVNQHLNVFKQRLEPFGVSVNSLSGGLTLKKRNSIKAKWVESKTDVLISTTAALYDSVFIKDASLAIIDEEHRFGVKDKESLVNKFVNKDVLYMSATPIPRTLHLSLSGVHDISTLSTPPFLRKPIVTVVSYFSKKLIKQAIVFELNRGGQVFYVHNRIDTINSIKTLIESLSPSVAVKVVHSKVSSNVTKSLLLDFANQKYNVLLCTSIVGSGIDIPNANTIIINKANLFGLSQLHQIRGRVGRSDQQGYAYLMVPKNIKLNAGAKKRLKSIEKNTSLGSGYNIARSDLEIRGAGTVFGYKQSGSGFDVGYEYYSKVVSGCVENKFKKNLIGAVDSFTYRVNFVCSFERAYVGSDYERLRLYRDLSNLYTLKEVNGFRYKVEKVYGVIPLGGENIINMRKCSILCSSKNIINMSYNKGQLTLFFNNNFNDMDCLIKFLNSNVNKFSILDFTFGVVSGSTNIKINFKENVNINGLFLCSFMEVYNGFYKV